MPMSTAHVRSRRSSSGPRFRRDESFAPVREGAAAAKRLRWEWQSRPCSGLLRSLGRNYALDPSYVARNANAVAPVAIASSHSPLHGFPGSQASKLPLPVMPDEDRAPAIPAAHHAFKG